MWGPSSSQIKVFIEEVSKQQSSFTCLRCVCTTHAAQHYSTGQGLLHWFYWGQWRVSELAWLEGWRVESRKVSSSCRTFYLQSKDFITCEKVQGVGEDGPTLTTSAVLSCWWLSIAGMAVLNRPTGVTCSHPVSHQAHKWWGVNRAGMSSRRKRTGFTGEGVLGSALAHQSSMPWPLVSLE